MEDSADKNGILVRSGVLESALVLEEATSIYLAMLLDISLEDTRCFGNSGDAFSFNNKINLLLDIGAFTKDEKKCLCIL